MKNILLQGIIVLCLLLSSCNTKGFRVIDDGVIINIEGSDMIETQNIMLKVISPHIIHVLSTVEKEFSTEESLILDPLLETNAQFTVDSDEEKISLFTDFIEVNVSRKTGEIVFYDKEGNTLLAEKHGGGKLFTPIEVEGTKGYTLQQVFESPDDEAFYGLGQHQSDEFNYKGKNETLFQYNTKVSIPFIVSNKNYGILWDNYSLSKFGDSRDYEQLNKFKLYNKDGKDGFLTATYIDKSNSGKTYSRDEACIDYETLELVKNFPENIKLADVKVLWEGDIESNETGDYRFLLHYAGYTKIYLNNELVVPERWRTAWNPNDYKFSYNFKKGEKVSFRIEWEPDGDISYISLKALSPVLENEQNRLSLWSEMGNEINYYFIHGADMDEIISGYRKVTGKSQIMPKWAMGFWQSRERYKTQDELLENFKEFRNRKIPIDNIVQDWSYWPVDSWGSHDFDLDRFPDAKMMVDSVHAMNGRVMISVWPKFYITTEHYKEFDRNGWMYQQAVKDSIRDWIYPGYIGSFYDAYAKGARKLFWDQLENKLYPKGFDAWWMDASEPNVQDNTSIEYRKALTGPTALGPSTKYFNAYSLVNAESIYVGQRSVDPNKRVFLLTRSGFSGIQRYSTAVWSGDIGTRWEDMKAQISAGLNFALSGVPYWTMDIGGFCVEKRYEEAQRVFDNTGIENNDLKEWRELNARWHQFGAFIPLFRSHGQFPYREMFNIADDNHPAYKSMLYYNNLRYRMMPYIYSMAGMTYLNDYTIMRALVMDYGADSKVLDVSDQYMFGNGLMVCPVYEYKSTSRNVYFPNTNGWYDLYSGKYIDGGQMLSVAAPYSQIPLFAPEGSIIPFGPEIQYSDEKSPDLITLYVYEGKDGQFTLYEDEGVNYNYEKGFYNTIEFTYDDSTKNLVISDRKGEFDGMLKARNFNIIFITKDNPIAFDPDAVGLNIVYDGKSQSINLK